jgi:hypothetical protein
MLLSGFTCETYSLVSNAIDFTLLMASHVFARLSLTLLVTSVISFKKTFGKTDSSGCARWIKE